MTPFQPHDPVIIDVQDAEVLADSELRRNPTALRFDAALLYGLMALLMFGPLAFGATEPWSLFVLQCGAVTLLGLWAAKQLVMGELRITPHPLIWPAAGFGLLITLQLLLGTSSYRYATGAELMRYVVYGILFFVATQLLRRRRELRIFALGMTGFGFLVAVFAILQSLSSNGKIYWLRAPAIGGGVFGPYVNHNHYAGLMEMLVPFALVLWLERKWEASTRIMLLFAGVVMAASIFLSISRGGMIAFAVEMAVFAFVLLRRRGPQESRKPLIGVVVVLVLLLAWLGGGQVTRSIATLQTPMSEGVAGFRLQIARDSLRMFTAHPVLGWGLGVFPYGYPQYRSFYTSLFINHAHNDYVELLVDTGIAGAALTLWFLFILFRRGVSKTRHWRSNPGRAVGLAGFLGCLGILVHSLSDFNLHIPANAALFFVLCAVATNKSSDGDPRARLRREERGMREPLLGPEDEDFA